MTTNCLFCRIAKKEIPSEIIHEDDSSVAIRDINPQAPTHILILPKRHLARLDEMSEADQSLLGHLHWVAVRKAKQERLTDFRIVINNGGSAGQSVWHLHLHLLGGRPFSWPPG
jgi:histidine triad (HIT) family protein